MMSWHHLLIFSSAICSAYSAVAVKDTDLKVFRGEFKGECEDDGLYYMDEHSFIMCNSKNFYIQPCPPGTMNQPYDGFDSGSKYAFENFCDINLVNYGYTEHQHLGFDKKVEEEGDEYNEDNEIDSRRYEKGDDAGGYEKDEHRYDTQERYDEDRDYEREHHKADSYPKREHYGDDSRDDERARYETDDIMKRRLESRKEFERSQREASKHDKQRERYRSEDRQMVKEHKGEKYDREFRHIPRPRILPKLRIPMPHEHNEDRREIEKSEVYRPIDYIPPYHKQKDRIRDHDKRPFDIKEDNFDRPPYPVHYERDGPKLPLAYNDRFSDIYMRRQEEMRRNKPYGHSFRDGPTPPHGRVPFDTMPRLLRERHGPNYNPMSHKRRMENDYHPKTFGPMPKHNMKDDEFIYMVISMPKKMVMDKEDFNSPQDLESGVKIIGYHNKDGQYTPLEEPM